MLSQHVDTASAVLMCIKPERPDLHLGLTESDLTRLFVHLATPKISSFCYPTKPGPYPSLGFTFVEFPSQQAKHEGLALLHGGGNSPLVIAGLGTLVITEAEDTYEKMLKQAAAIYEESFVATNVNKIIPLKKHIARFGMLHIFTRPGFDLTAAILGERNRNIEYILERSLRSVSVTIEGVPTAKLHVNLTSLSEQYFVQAVDMVEDLLRAVCILYVKNCVAQGVGVNPRTGFIRHRYVDLDGSSQPDQIQLVQTVEAPNEAWMNYVPDNLLTGSRFSGPQSPPHQQQQTQQQPKQFNYHNSGAMMQPTTAGVQLASTTNQPSISQPIGQGMGAVVGQQQQWGPNNNNSNRNNAMSRQAATAFDAESRQQQLYGSRPN